METIKLIKGTDLTEEQKKMLTFRGMSKPHWVKAHSFYFENGKPAEGKYPVCHSIGSILPY